MSTSDKYIGSMPSSEFAAELNNRISIWTAGLSRNGLINQFRRNYRLYYNTDPNAVSYNNWDSYSISGSDGEYLNVRVGLFRNFVQHMLNLIFAKPPGLKAIASNSSGPSLDAARLFNNVINEMFSTQRANRHVKKAGEYGLVFGTGFGLVEWDSMLGEPYTAKDDQNIITDGGIRIRAKSVFDVFWDNGKEEWDDNEWVVVRDSINKFVLAKQVPDKAEEILKIESKDRSQKTLFFFDQLETDEIFIYKFYHKPVSPSFLPNGRYVLMAGDNTILYDGENPYDGLPVFKISPMEGIGTCYGYTPANDLAPLQMFYNLLMTSMATNISTHGVGNVAVERGSDLGQSKLAGGMNIIEYAPGTQPPQPMSLLQMPPELGNLAEMVEQLMEEITGINSVIRGDPDGNLKSGKALAIVQSQAIQFMSGFQMSVVNFVEDIGNFMLKLLQKFATTERMTQIVGENEISETFEWNNQTMMQVARIRAEVVDPFMHTVTGKLEKADALLQAGLITDPTQYLTISETGNDEPMYDAPLSSIKRIREENRMLKLGKEPLILNTDPHEKDISEHLTVLDHPETRNNPQICQVALNHIMKHQMALQGVQFDVMGNVLQPPPQQAPPGIQQAPPPQSMPPMQQQQLQQGLPPGAFPPIGLSQIQGRPPPMGAQPVAQ